MNYTLLSKARLFDGMSEESIKSMLDCLSATTKFYRKGEIIFHEGQLICTIGMVLSGGVNIEHIDYGGSKNVLSHVSPTAIFGETYACIGTQPLLVDVTACENSEILFLDVAKLLTVCTNSCAHHTLLIHNLLAISSQKNLLLSRRMFHTSFKTLRGKLLSYFSFLERQSGSKCFTVPFNRQQLADYLNADRSAICNEISKMKKDGIIEVSKNTFTLLKESENN